MCGNVIEELCDSEEAVNYICYIYMHVHIVPLLSAVSTGCDLLICLLEWKREGRREKVEGKRGVWGDKMSNQYFDDCV